MEIVEIKDIEREPGHIYYRRTYHGVSIISIPGKNVELPVQFTIEMDPLGKKTIELNLQSEIDYPLLPIRKALMNFVLALDNEDKLLC